MAISHGWTWTWWGILIASGLPMWESPTATALFVVGGIGVLGGAHAAFDVRKTAELLGNPGELMGYLGFVILLGSVLYTWIYNHTGRSVLGAVLFHYSGNLSGELLDAPPLVYTYERYLTAVLVLLVLWVRRR